MRLVTICSSEPLGTDLPGPVPELLPVQPTRRRYPLLEFLRASPLLRSDIAFNSPGVPLSLRIRLSDGAGHAIRHAAVYIWHHDSHGWTFDPRDDEIGAVTFMRGVQISDPLGTVCFQTIYPGRYPDRSVPVYLQVYFNDGQHVVARTDACLLLPECEIPPPEEPLPPPTLPQPLSKPRFNTRRDAVLVAVSQLQPDPDTGGMTAEVLLRIALNPLPARH